MVNDWKQERLGPSSHFVQAEVCRVRSDIGARREFRRSIRLKDRRKATPIHHNVSRPARDDDARPVARGYASGPSRSSSSPAGRKVDHQQISTDAVSCTRSRIASTCAQPNALLFGQVPSSVKTRGSNRLARAQPGLQCA